MIDPKTGSIIIDSPGVIITRDLTRQQFLQGALAGIAKSLIENLPWLSYSCKPITLHGESFAAGFYFHESRLDLVDLCVMRPEFGTSWSDWSQQKELARKRFHDLLLDSILGADWRKRRFEWGNVYSELDPKSGGSSIGIRYESLPPAPML